MRYLVVSSRAREEIYQFVGFRQLDVKNGFNTMQMLISFTKAPSRGGSDDLLWIKDRAREHKNACLLEYKQM